MSDFYVNDLQLNTGDLNSNISFVGLGMNFNNRNTSIPGNYRGVAYPISGQNEEMSVKLTIWGRGDVWSQLITKRKELISVLKTQAEQKLPILIRSSDVDIYQDFKSVYILIESVDLPTDGKNGTNLLDISFDCIVLGVPAVDGGSFTLQEIWEIDSE